MNTTTALRVWIPGQPKPQGSKRHVGNGIMVEASRDVGAWRDRVALFTHQAMRGEPLLTGPLSVALDFVLPRPKSAPKTRTPPATRRPDVDKLARAVLDALTNTAIHDDSLITALHATKRVAHIGEAPGVTISIEQEEPGP